MMSIAWKLTKHGFSFVDADSGIKVSCYQWYDVVLCRKKDKKGRWIKKEEGGNVYGFNVQYIGVLDACYSDKPKPYNLHIECLKYKTIDVDEYNDIKDLKEDIKDIAQELKSECFSSETPECFDYFNIDEDNKKVDQEVQFRLEKGEDKCHWDRC